MNFNKVTLFGFEFITANDVGEITDALMQAAAAHFDGDVNFLITLNAFLVVNFLDKKNKTLLEKYKQSAYVLPDGMPIIWLGKMRYKVEWNRLTGSDLFPGLWKEVKEKKYHATFVLPNNLLAESFNKEYNLCSSFVPKFFNPDEKEYIQSFAEEVADKIIASKSRFLFLGLTFPKQEMLGAKIAELLKEKNYNEGILILCLGASFEFYFDLKKRAPLFFQKTGLEWLYRFALEPKRLWKRYTVDNIRFINLSIKELTRKRQIN
ncbi:WecB/TagA/CpsF family glycosyltransferase [Taibaiella soli]|uniref:Glycosyltransferase n=1 Tax=Taibaiella soli TaxID=1649169 RepID=A0A2W2B904_9BACT|nr:WecB/TagA/CpsF family glycosyltransferase [Taibaiella soli]PZF72397.1 hypothetical protein DN068_13670 [Taibaiella soli]